MAQRKTASKLKRPTRHAAKGASRKSKSSARTRGRSSESRRSGDEVVTIDRRRTDRREEERAGAPAAPPLERRKKVNRRRQIDPTTCERDYTDDEIEFMNALDNYKRASGRMFPTCSEVLEVVRSLGYVRLSPSEAATHGIERPEQADTKMQLEAMAVVSTGDWQ